MLKIHVDWANQVAPISEHALTVDLAVERRVPGGTLFHELGKQSGLVGGQPFGGHVVKKIRSGKVGIECLPQCLKNPNSGKPKFMLSLWILAQPVVETN